MRRNILKNMVEIAFWQIQKKNYKSNVKMRFFKQFNFLNRLFMFSLNIFLNTREPEFSGILFVLKQTANFVNFVGLLEWCLAGTYLGTKFTTRWLTFKFKFNYQ